MIFDIAGIEEKIGYSFSDKMMLRKCFTHSSYAFENGEKDNELLEFFGDAIIQFIVTEYLYKNSSGDEGKLTKKRAEMVSKEPLLRVIKKLDLGKYMLLGKGQKKNSNQDEKLFSSLYEALVAGIYLDGGLSKAKAFITKTLIKDFPFKEEKFSFDTSAKNDYQEYVQQNRLGSVGYETLSVVGPDHKPLFRVVALLNNGRIAEGEGPSKKQAEAAAAFKALDKLKKQAGKHN